MLAGHCMEVDRAFAYILFLWVKNGCPFPSIFQAPAMPAHKKWPQGIQPPIPADPHKVAQGQQLQTPLHSHRGLG